MLQSVSSESTLTPYKLFRRSVQSLVEALIRRLKGADSLVLPEMFNTLSVQHYLEERLVDSSGHVCLLLDDNMYYRSMRYSYYQLARKCESF